MRRLSDPVRSKNISGHPPCDARQPERAELGWRWKQAPCGPGCSCRRDSTTSGRVAPRATYLLDLVLDGACASSSSGRRPPEQCALAYRRPVCCRPLVPHAILCARAHLAIGALTRPDQSQSSDIHVSRPASGSSSSLLPDGSVAPEGCVHPRSDHQCQATAAATAVRHGARDLCRACARGLRTRRSDEPQGRARGHARCRSSGVHVG